MRKQFQLVAGWAGGMVLLTGMPLLGVWLAGAPLAPYLQMPPRTNFVPHAPFSWPIFWGLALFIVVVVWPFMSRVLVARRNPIRCRLVGHFGRFPWWGWLALLAGLGAWILAWTRFSWFRSFQPFTFTPIWLSYIVVMNALAYRRTGRSPLTHHTGPYLSLFPLSALFWWFFEYLNRFVQNWHYIGIGTLTADEYVLRATLPFATVLPAFVATRAWLASYPGIWTGLAEWKPLVPSHPRLLAWLALAVAAAGLAGIGIWHEFLFPLLWVAPLIIIASLRVLAGVPTLLSDPARGDWRGIAMAALAALLCGFFWEMWNVFSLEKWIYTVPFVDRFHLFEMPLLGYSGYLPFGIECALMAELVGLTGKEEPHD
jgi:hypothetical protein